MNRDPATAIDWNVSAMLKKLKFFLKFVTSGIARIIIKKGSIKNLEECCPKKLDINKEVSEIPKIVFPFDVMFLKKIGINRPIPMIVENIPRWLKKNKLRGKGVLVSL